jgi:hypothetical protein
MGLGVGIEILTRLLCFVVHTVIIFLLEEDMAFNQLRVVVLLWLNSFYHACSVSVNPAISLLLLAVVTHSPFKSAKLTLAANTVERKQQAKQEEVDDDVLPFRQKSATSVTGEVTDEESSIEAILKSVVILRVLLAYRDALTPDLFHFVTCLEADQVHVVWTFVLWATFKNFLRPAKESYLNQSSVLAAIEATIAIVLSDASFVPSLSLFLSLILLSNLRYKFSRLLTPWVIFFVVFYLILNFWANLIDFIWNQVFKGMIEAKHYYHDDDMADSFSFKVHMFVLCATLAFVCGQIFLPSIEALKRVPELLPELYNFTFLICISMFLTFLYELTSYDPVKRTRLFRTELTKAFMTCIIFQATTLFMTTWFFSIGGTIRAEQNRKLKDVENQQR